MVAAISFAGAKREAVGIAAVADVATIARNLVVADGARVARCVLPLVHARAGAIRQKASHALCVGVAVAGVGAHKPTVGIIATIQRRVASAAVAC